MSRPCTTQKDRIYLHNMKKQGKKVPQSKLKEIWGPWYLTPKEYYKNKNE